MEGPKKSFTVWSDFLDDKIGRGDAPLPECAIYGADSFSEDENAQKQLKKALLELVIKYDIRSFRVAYRNALGMAAADFLRQLKEFYSTLVVRLVVAEEDSGAVKEMGDWYDMTEIAGPAQGMFLSQPAAVMEHMVNRSGYMIHYESLMTYKLRRMIEDRPGNRRFTLIQIGDADIIPDEKHMEQPLAFAK